MPNYLTISEVAERVRSSDEAVRKWVRAGLLPAHRPGGRRLLIDERDLIAFVDGSKAMPSKGAAL